VLCAVHDRLNQQRRDGCCAFDAGLTFGRLGMRSKWRAGGDCRRQK
jgi:hypothetical protein